MASFNTKFQPIFDDLNKTLAKVKGDNQEEAFFKFLKDVREGKADIPPRAKKVVELATKARDNPPPKR